MEYRIIFYATENEETPMLDFLASLQESHDVLHKLVTAGLGKIRNRDNHGAPLTTPVHGSPGLFELRVGRTDIARVFFFFQPDRAIVCTNGYVKKTTKLDRREIERAMRHRADWESRRTENEGSTNP